MSYQARLAAFYALPLAEQLAQMALRRDRAAARAALLAAEPCSTCGRTPADGGCEPWCIEAARGARRCDEERDDGI